MDKLSATASTHITSEAKRQLIALAEMNGLDESQLFRKVLMDFIAGEQRVYEVLHGVFKSATDAKET